MKTSKNTDPSALKVLASYIIYRISGKRIVTKTARLKIDEARQKHKERINAMQKELDKEHQELRGWTNETRNGSRATHTRKPAVHGGKINMNANA